MLILTIPPKNSPHRLLTGPPTFPNGRIRRQSVAKDWELRGSRPLLVKQRLIGSPLEQKAKFATLLELRFPDFGQVLFGKAHDPCCRGLVSSNAADVVDPAKQADIGNGTTSTIAAFVSISEQALLVCFASLLLCFFASLLICLFAYLLCFFALILSLAS